MPVLTQMDFEILDLTPGDAISFYQLPRLPHKDPFDRLLLAQARAEGMMFITCDASIARYQESVLTV